MKVAIEGCAHGELDIIYDTVQNLEKQQNIKVDLLICCGDFESTRNKADLLSMAVPAKYRRLNSFYKYYNQEKVAPILTIFIGGNHEASNYLQELPYGGWVAPNIYYLGYAGIINVAGVRIGGISGIYKPQDYLKGHFEIVPYSEDTKRSVYHIRNLEIFRLKQVTNPVNIFLSHDWPNGIWNHGDVEKLLKRKPFFREDIESNRLGSKPCGELLDYLKPNYWFAAHLHCKFTAVVNHSNDTVTNFMALDKCIRGRQFLEVVDVPHDSNSNMEISYDLEWLGILYSTNHLLSVKKYLNYMPNDEKFPLSDEIKSLIETNFGDLKVPLHFEKTADANSNYNKGNSPPLLVINPQTEEFCRKLNVDDPIQLLTNGKLSRNDTSQNKADQTFEPADDLLDCSPAKKSFSPMSLPTPQHDSYNCSSSSVSFNNSTFVSDTTLEISQEFLSETETLDQSSTHNSTNELAPTEPDPSETGALASSTPRGFKRRNLSFYSPS